MSDEEYDLEIEPYAGSVIPSKETIRDIIWQSKDGKLTRLRDMTDQHLRNTALMLMGLGFSSYTAPDAVKIKWLSVLRLEWEARMYERNAHKVDKTH